MSNILNGPADMVVNTPKKPRRSSGRKDELTSRELLLRAARKEFAAKGLEGARVDEIARRAGVNKQLVYHHFTNKVTLYRMVLEDAYAGIRAEEIQLDAYDGDPHEVMVRLVAFSFDYLAANRDFVALLTDQNLHRARHLKKSENLPQMHSPLIAMISKTLERGVASGRFKEGLDPVQLYISIAGLGFFYFSNIHTLSSIFDCKFNDKERIEERRTHVINLVMQALRPD